MSEFRKERNNLFIGNNKIKFSNTVGNIKKCGNYYIVFIDAPTVNNVSAVNFQLKLYGKGCICW